MAMNPTRIAAIGDKTPKARAVNMDFRLKPHRAKINKTAKTAGITPQQGIGETSPSGACLLIIHCILLARRLAMKSPMNTAEIKPMQKTKMLKAVGELDRLGS